jgi:hypothetical protein
MTKEELKKKLELTPEEMHTYCYGGPCKNKDDYITCNDCETLLQKGAEMLLNKVLESGELYVKKNCEYYDSLGCCTLDKTKPCPHPDGTCNIYIPLSELEEK